jgi:RHS repeat-associated protein
MVRYQYDLFGNKIEQVDEVGNSTRYAYHDQTNRLQFVHEYGQNPPFGSPQHQTEYTFDSVGNLTAIKDAEGRTRTYPYDPANKLITETDLRGKKTEHWYDAVGNREMTVDRKGQEIRYDYDALNRLTQIHGAKPIAAFTYDSRGNRKSMTDASGTSAWVYDSAGWLRVLQTPDGRTLNWGYDAAGRVSSVSDGITNTGEQRGQVQYQYDYQRDGRLVKVVDFDQQAIGFDYDRSGRRSRIAYPNAVDGTFTYDLAGRPEQVGWARGGETLAAYSYGYDKAGRLQSRTDAAGSYTYMYDDFHRLKQENAPDRQIAYSYDKVGNRTGRKVHRNGLDHLYGYEYYPGTNLLKRAETEEGIFAYVYDANGNMVNDGHKRYDYDRLNRLTRVEIPGNREIGYQYNGDGLVAARTTNGQTTRYHYDRGMRYLETSGGADVARTAFAQGPLVRQVSGQGRAYFVTDGHGDVRGLYDAAGRSVGSYSYGAFGEKQEASGSFNNPFRYTGELWEEEVGLLYLRARFYAPGVGRFVTEDPYQGQLEVPWTHHRFVYTGNNPLNLWDPSGHIPVPLIYAGYVAFTWLALNGPDVVELAVDAVDLAMNPKCSQCWMAVGMDGLALGAPGPQAPNDGPTSVKFKKPENGGYLYRGVHAGHPAIEAAKQGRVFPGNVNGTVTPEMHNAGYGLVDSPYTSWTRRPDVANNHARANGPGGAVLRVPEGAPPEGATWSWEWSRDRFAEGEILLRGIRNGAEVIEPW